MLAHLRHGSMQQPRRVTCCFPWALPGPILYAIIVICQGHARWHVDRVLASKHPEWIILGMNETEANVTKSFCVESFPQPADYCKLAPGRRIIYGAMLQMCSSPVSYMYRRLRYFLTWLPCRPPYMNIFVPTAQAACPDMGGRASSDLLAGMGTLDHLFWTAWHSLPFSILAVCHAYIVRRVSQHP